MKKISSFILAFMLLMSTFTNITISADTQVANQSVDFKIKNRVGDTIDVINDNVFVGEDVPIVVGNGFILDINFDLDGDLTYPGGFELDLISNDLFKIDHTGGPQSFVITHEGVPIEVGSFVFETVNGRTKAVFTFNQNIDLIDNTEDLFISVVGQVSHAGETEIINGVVVEVLPRDGFNWESVVDGEGILKFGDSNHGDGIAQWWIRVNQDAGIKYFNEGVVPNMVNLNIYDDLNDGMHVSLGTSTQSSNVRVYSVLRIPSFPIDYSNLISSPNTVDIDITNRFARLQVDANTMTYEEFEAHVKSLANPTIAVYNGTGVIVHYGDLPSIKYISQSGDFEDFRKSFTNQLSNVYNLSDEEVALALDVIKEKYFDISYEDQNVIEMLIGIKAEVDETGTYENQARMEYNDVTIVSGTASLKVIKTSSGGSGSTNGSAKLIKKDLHSNAFLEDVGFKLQKYDPTTDSFNDYISYGVSDLVQYTNAQGEILFKRLETGKYKLVEVSPLEGYKDTVIFDDHDGVFDFVANEPNIEITAYNVIDTKTVFTVEKVWVTDETEVPNASFQLYQNGIEYMDIITLISGDSNFTWDDLPLFDLDGNMYQYTVEEVDVPDGYTVSYENVLCGDVDHEDLPEHTHYTIVTNTHEPIEPEIPIDPEKPIDPEVPLVPVIPEVPTESVKPVIPKEKEDYSNEKEQILPSTGVSSSVKNAMLLIISGVVLLGDRSSRKRQIL